ncbi:hypothetical protein ASG40_11595 [Methylobacterium sp. Leaf399]|uniref:hypothetical protein n=1 Tax=Methylobacterium sp. Leaf399 TaxID=1736364 RepID=UPI000700BEC2|nr:hypothetical protein [Methylobacterium sp. Leaf399]KQT08516.1 hypothetical protein ASG40_11595 [Methylobacterium sp. Leaf399]
MGKRGFQSAASLTTAATAVLDRVERQRPPHDLTDEEVEVWAAAVSTEAADWLSPSNAPLLTQYCRHVINARRIGQLIERATSDPDLAVKDYDRLLKMQERESRAVATLSTKLRISPHSNTNHRGNAKGPGAARKPWES